MLCVAGGEIETSYPSYLRDESKLSGGRADLLFFPESEAEVIDSLKILSGKGLPVTVSGGRTGIVGGAAPFGGCLISLEKMNRLIGFGKSPDGQCLIRLQAGITVRELNRALRLKDFRQFSFFTEADHKSAALFLADPQEYFYPVDATEDSAQIGGNAATNASGARSFHYGPTRSHISALRVVLTDGSALAVRRGEYTADRSGRLGRIFQDQELIAPNYRLPGVKNAAGFFSGEGLDLIDLFIGSEGTLGIITEVELLLSPKPEEVLTFLVFCSKLENTLDLVDRARSLPSGNRPLAIEFFDQRSLAFLRSFGAAERDPVLAGLPEAAAAVMFEVGALDAPMEDLLTLWEELLPQCGISTEDAWIEEEGSARNRIRHIRHALPESINNLIARRQWGCPGIRKVSTDFAVPSQYLQQLIESYQLALGDLDYVLFGHIGDAHLHANVLPRDLKELETAGDAYHDIAHWVVSVGGTVSAEHGIGKLKRDLLELMYGPEALAEMRRVKEYFDPEGRLNPGVMFFEV